MSQIAANGGQPQIGEVFGKWTLVAKTGKGSYVCRCECGVEKPIGSTELLRGARKKGCRRCQIGFPTSESGFNGVFGSYKHNALKRNHPFELSKEEARNLFQSPCYYCGELPTTSDKGFVHGGIDRANNKLGYILSNCLPCCKMCNRIKNTFSYDEFLAHIKKILERRG